MREDSHACPHGLHWSQFSVPDLVLCVRFPSVQWLERLGGGGGVGTMVGGGGGWSPIAAQRTTINRDFRIFVEQSWDVLCFCGTTVRYPAKTCM